MIAGIIILIITNIFWICYSFWLNNDWYQKANYINQQWYGCLKRDAFHMNVLIQKIDRLEAELADMRGEQE